MIGKNYSNLVIINKMSNHDDTTNNTSCYWLCNRKAELKVYTDCAKGVMRYTILHID
jgi:hypothetical protein